jgi:hypothetical protein
MTASTQDISRWFDTGIEQEATHVIVVCDTYDHDDYPVYVSKGEDVHKVAEKYNGSNMQTIMEVYNMSMDKAKQMAQHRAFNY